MFPRRQTKSIFLVLLLSLLLTGCGVFDGKLPGLGGGRSDTLRGRVVFGDTNLGLVSTVTFESTTVDTHYGNFTVNLPHGTHDYLIRNLLGEYTGSVRHDGVGTKRLVVPTFEGWSRHYFDTLLVLEPLGATTRWPRDTEIPVWIESPAEDDNVTWEVVSTVWDALDEWENVLAGTIRFKETGDRSLADANGLTISFISREEMDDHDDATPNTIGLCELWYYAGRGQIGKGNIYIVYDFQDSIALLLHEIGHCIGLRHSDDPREVMYPVLRDKDRRLTAREKNIARLLYSIPQRTPAFSTSFFMTEPPEVDEYGRVKNVISTVH